MRNHGSRFTIGHVSLGIDSILVKYTDHSQSSFLMVSHSDTVSAIPPPPHTHTVLELLQVQDWHINHIHLRTLPPVSGTREAPILLTASSRHHVTKQENGHTERKLARYTSPSSSLQKEADLEKTNSS